MIIEELPIHHYEVKKITKSLIDPEIELTTVVGVKCPNCKTMLRGIGHGIGVICNKCGMSIIQWGGTLLCKLKSRENNE